MIVVKSSFMRCLILLVLAIGMIAAISNPSLPVEPKDIQRLQALKLLSSEIAGIVQEAERALVFVTVTRMVQVTPSMPDLFEHFFGGPRHSPREEKFEKRIVSASGFFIDLDKGYIVTNAHVVKDSKNIVLTLANGDEYEGVVTGADSNTDIAVLQVADKNFRREGLDRLQLTSNSNELRAGEFVVALGAPFGFKASVSLGIVSGLQRGNLRGLTPLGNFIQTDAAINPGNSGGPLLNVEGKVIGVNSAIYSVSGGYNGLGFAVPVEIVRKVARQLIESGTFARGYLGVGLQELSPDMRTSFQIEPGEGGVIITEIATAGPAAQAGLQAGDVILAIDGQKVTTPFELVNAIGFNPPDTVVEVGYVRDGNRVMVKVKLGEVPSQATQQKINIELWGVQLEEVGSYSEHGALGRSLRVLASNNVKSDIHRGDVIVAVDSIEVQGLDWFKEYLKDKKEVVLYVNRGGQYLFVTLHRK